MGYVPLNNYNHDGGYKRIQSGPNHQGFIVLTSGSTAYGADEGIIVPGSPLSGNLAQGVWGYDPNWRYVPSTLPSQSGSLDPTPYNVSGALDTYDATRIYTRDNVAGAQAASAIGPETGKVNPRGAALQPRADVTRPETYMYFGGAAPDNQDYSPYNTPDANSAAEGKTGGGVTHRSYESSLLTNVLGSQGTSDRSQWRYHQPVYCKTYTETRRSETPGLMSTPLRYVYRGSASSYNYNYAGELLANKGGFEPLNYDDFGGGCDIPPPCPTTTGDPLNPQPGDTLRGSSFCTYVSINWYNTGSSNIIGTGDTYTIQQSDYFYKIYYVVTYPNGSSASSSLDCLGVVLPNREYDYWAVYQQPITGSIYPQYRKVFLNRYGETFIIFWSITAVTIVNPIAYQTLNVQKRDINGVEIWTKSYTNNLGLNYQTFGLDLIATLSPNEDYIYVASKFRQYINPGFTPFFDGVEVYKVSTDNGSLIWRHKYETGLSSVNLKEVLGIHVDNYLNKLWFSVNSFNLSYHFAVNVDDPTDLYGGLVLNYSGSGAITGYPRSITVFRTSDNNKLIFVWEDESNRHVIFEADITGLSVNSVVKRIASSTTISAETKYICRFVPATADDGSLVYISAQGFSAYGARLILYDQNLNPIKTATSYGYVKNITVDPVDTKKVYITVFQASNSHLQNCGIQFGNNAFCAIYEMNGSLDTVKSCTAFTTFSGYAFIPPPEAETSDYCLSSNQYVNRAVITYTPYSYGGGQNTGGQISGQLTVGLPVIGSGNTANFAWPNPSGLIGAKSNLNITVGSGTVVTTTLTSTSTSASFRASGSVPTTVTDITGTIVETYAATNLN